MIWIMELLENLLELGLTQIIVISPSEVEGYIPAKDEEFYIHLKIKNTQPRKIRFRGTWRLQQLLLPVSDVLEQHLLLCSSIEDMLREIKNALEQQLSISERSNIPTLPSVSYYETLMKQLQDIGWDRVSFINEELNMIELRTIDDYHRQHILQVHLPKEFPNQAPTCSCDMPEEFSFKWSSKKTLSDLFDYFQSALQKYALFWNSMAEIDENVWVLDPENPTRKDCKRRIALVANAFLQIIVDPLCPSSIPVCHYLGPEQVITPLREKFNKSIDMWDENFSLLCNLRNALDIDFPSPLTSTKEELCIECGICYAHQLGEEIPVIMCSDSNCDRPFHRSCIYEWLRSLPTARFSFNTIFGECPYCTKPIWCAMPNT